MGQFKNLIPGIRNYSRSWKFLLLFGALIFGFVHFGTHFKNNFKEARYYQAWFSPAVASACGFGFQELIPDRSLAGLKLKKYLNQKPGAKDAVWSLNCDDLKNLERRKANPSALFHRYLVESMGLVWKYKGVKWINAYVIGGALGALTALAMSLLFSLLIPLPLAVPLMMVVSNNSLYEDWVIHLRDFSKAPFFLLILYLLLIYLKKLQKKEGYISLIKTSLVLGLTLGFSFGFRVDLKIMILPATVIFLVPLFTFPRRKILSTFLPFLVFLAGLNLTGWPVIYGQEKTYANWHVVLLGMSDQFDQNMGLDSPYYSKLAKYIDGLVLAKIASFNDRHTHRSNFVFKEKVYDDVGKRFYFEWLAAFPYDFWTKMEATFFALLDLPTVKLFTNGGGSFWYWWARFSLVVMMILVSSLDWALGLSVLFLLGFCFTFPSLQFDPRHFFHIEPVSFLIGLVPIYVLKLSTLKKIIEIGLLRKKVWVVQFTLLMLLLGILFFFIPSQLGKIQKNSIRQMVETIQKTPMVTLVLQTVAHSNQKRFLVQPSVLEGERPWKNVEYFQVTFDFNQCPRDSFEYEILWKSQWRGYNFGFSKKWKEIPKSVGKGFVIFPSHRIDDSEFKGVGLPQDYSDQCILKIDRLANLDGLKVLPIFHLMGPFESLPMRINYRD